MAKYNNISIGHGLQIHINNFRIANPNELIV